VGAAENTHHVYHAFLKNTGQPMQDLGVLGGEPGNPSHSEAYAINDLSQVVGGSTLPYNGNLHAFLKNPGQEMQDLGTLGKDLSLAFGINDSGQAVGVMRRFPYGFSKEAWRTYGRPGQPFRGR
jgi:probable HAF family extracellular repeat protein